MNPIVFSFLIILSFSIGGFLGFLAGNGSLVVKFDLAAWVGALGTVITAVVACRALHSWREQKIPDAKSSIIENLIIYDGIINHLMIEFNHTHNAIRYEKFVTTYLSLFNQLSIIESSIIKYYLFDSSCKKQIDPLYLKMKNSLNDFAKQISKYLNSNIDEKEILFNPDIISKAVLPFYMTHKLEFHSVLKKSLAASFALLKKIAGDDIVIRAKENQDNETKINGSS